MKNTLALLFGLFLSNVSLAQGLSAGGQIDGLVCDMLTLSGGDTQMKIHIQARSPEVSVAYIRDITMRPLGGIEMPTKLIAPILANNLAKMNGVTIVDDTKFTSSLSFKVSGQDYQGNARLDVVFKNKNGEMRFTSCAASRALYAE